MKYVVTADLHLSNYNNDKKIDGLPERLFSIMTTLEQMANFATENNISRVIIAGDVYDTKNIIYSLAQNTFVNYLRKWNDLQFFMIDGNHDVANKTGNGESSLDVINSLQNVVVFHKSSIIDNILFVPWYHNMINDIKSEQHCKFLVAHLGVNEAQLSSGISVVSDIKMSDLSKFETCWFGHYHKPQHIKNMYYVGSPIQLNAGEREEKRFLVIDTFNGSTVSIPTVGYKKYIQLEVRKENYNEIIQKAKDLKSNGDHVSLVVKETINSDEINKFQIIDKRDVDISNRGINRTMSEDEIIEKYLTVKEIHEDKKMYLEKAKEIIGGAVNENI